MIVPSRSRRMPGGARGVAFRVTFRTSAGSRSTSSPHLASAPKSLTSYGYLRCEVMAVIHAVPGSVDVHPGTRSQEERQEPAWVAHRLRGGGRRGGWRRRRSDGRG